jgi:tetratricopeptide (TPR) repeat protein
MSVRQTLLSHDQWRTDALHTWTEHASVGDVSNPRFIHDQEVHLRDAAMVRGPARTPGLIPILRAATKNLERGSPESAAAHRHLAELLVEDSPWEASIAAREALRTLPHDDSAWASLGLAQTLLGHYGLARKAYERACAVAPENPWYAHNLGHLLDVGLGLPAEGLPHLERSVIAVADNADFAISYAHALARLGRLAEAQASLQRLPASDDRDQLLRWVRQGAGDMVKTPKPGRDEALRIGLTHLPFTRHEQARIRLLYRAIRPRFPKVRESELGAACVFAFVEETGFPLSASEVAAPFQVKLGVMRALLLRIKRIRTHSLTLA